MQKIISATWLFTIFSISITTIYAHIDLNTVLQQIKPHLSASDYQALSLHCEEIALTIATTPKQTQEALTKKLIKSIKELHSSRRPIALDDIEQDAINQSFSEKRFFPYQSPFHYIGMQAEQFNHLKPVWKILAIVCLCSLSYLAIKILKNIGARSVLKKVEAQYDCDKALIDSLGKLTTTLTSKRSEL